MDKQTIVEKIRRIIAEHCHAYNGLTVFGTGYVGCGTEAVSIISYAVSLLLVDKTSEQLCNKDKELFAKFALDSYTYLCNTQVGGDGKTRDGRQWGMEASDRAIYLYVTLFQKLFSPEEKAIPVPATVLAEDTPVSYILRMLNGNCEELLSVLIAADEYNRFGFVADCITYLGMIPDGLIPDEIREAVMDLRPFFGRQILSYGKCSPFLRPTDTVMFSVAVNRFYGISLKEPGNKKCVSLSKEARNLAGEVLADVISLYPPEAYEDPSFPDMSDSDTPIACTVRGKQRDVFFSLRDRLLTVMPKNGEALSFAFDSLFARVESEGKSRIGNNNYQLEMYKGGFLLYGSHRITDTDIPGEPGAIRPFAVYYTAVAVLPDDETVLILQNCETEIPCQIGFSAGLGLKMAHGAHTYYFGETKRASDKNIRERFTAIGRYFNFDDQLGVVTQSDMTLLHEDGFDCLYGDINASPCEKEAHTQLFHTAAALAVGGIRRTRALCDTFLTLDGLPSGVSAVSAVAANRKRYTLLFNRSETDFSWEGHSLASGEAVLISWDR